MRAAITQRLLAQLTPAESPYDVRDTKLPGLMVRVHPSGKQVYLVQYGRGQRKNIGRVDLISLDEARGQARRMLVDGPPQSAPVPNRMPTLAEFLADLYAPWVEAHRKDGKATLARLHAACCELLALPLNGLTPAVVEQWRTQRLAQVAKTTANRDLVALRSCLTKAVEWGVLPTHPLAAVKALKTDRKGRVRYLSGDEEQRLRAALVARESRRQAGRGSGNRWRAARGYTAMPETVRDPLRPMVLISLNTGLRQGELFSLTWDDVDFTQSLLTVRSENAKSGRTRHLPLNAEALTVLCEWRGDSQTGLVFPSRTGGRIDNVQKSWSTVLKIAAISDFRWHDLRHSFASHLVMRGVSLAVVRELLGHASMEMTLRYSHLAPENLREAVKVLEHHPEIRDAGCTPHLGY